MKGTQATCTKCDSLQVITKFSLTTLNTVWYSIHKSSGGAVKVNNLVGRFTCNVQCTLHKFINAHTRLVQTSVSKTYRLALG